MIAILFIFFLVASVSAVPSLRQVSTLPFAFRGLYGMSVAGTDTDIYLFGGCSDTCHSNLARYNIPAGTWEISTTTISPRRNASVIVSKEKGIYIFGGINSQGEILNDMWHRTDTWVQIQGPGRVGNSVSLVGNKIYMFGGYTIQPTNEMWVLSLDTNTWRILSPTSPLGIPMAPAPRVGMAYASDASSIYIRGGGATLSDRSYRDMFRYDVGANRWTQMDSLDSDGVLAMGSSLFMVGKVCAQMDNPGTIGSMWRRLSFSISNVQGAYGMHVVTNAFLFKIEQ